MSHEIDMSTGRAAFARAAGTDAAWHGLGSEVAAGASIHDWQVAGGLNFKVVKGELLFKTADGVIHAAPKGFNRSVLYRDDTMKALSVMSENRYNIHQPEDILAGMKAVSDEMGWPVDTVGSLYDGRKIWALLKLPEAFELPGGDKVTGHLLASGCFDGSAGSDFRFVSTRVVCKNTLQMAMGENGTVRAVAYHSAALDMALVRNDLGIGPSVWANFIETAKRLASVKVSETVAKTIIRKVFDKPAPKVVQGVRLTDDQFIGENETPRRILSLFNGAGIGANMTSALGTGWGLVNAVTQDTDHFGSNRNSRLNSAWFGPGAARKQAVVDAVLAL